MKAATIKDDGVLVVDEHPDPEPGKGEVLVRVKAAGLNGADMLQRRGGYPAPPGSPPDIPGLELAGEVAALGPGATRFSEGDRVMAIVGGGGQAELAVVHERQLMPVPQTLEWPAAGAVPEVFTTAHDAVFTQAELRPGERLLVNGAAGGVGTAAVQLGVAAGADVTGIARHNADAVAALGASTEPAGEYDVILELVGGENLTDDVERLAPRGRLAVIGTGAGARAEINFGLVMRKRARLHGSTLRSRSAEEKALVVERLAEDALPLLAAGKVTVPLHATFSLDRVEEAYEAFAAPGKFGKLVLVR